ncbi:hypothetical protein AWC38_SpisGene17359 [Stylophora pistillata]|uniref:C-type lectin domain-containing protein n=1 Tax=Stylophora pistillata TaxID=50429 RepID=A0A2B4RP12_STYPI|nr:hypothetical protein AWC38_SpisGene17359 [Stylophora pistillata]
MHYLLQLQLYLQYPAVDKVYGGHVTPTHLLEDMELINLVMKTKRPDGKPNAPIWITTEENEDWDDLHCTVVTPDGLQTVVSCDSLYPFVCARAVLQCFSCIPNTTMVPPFLCDKPTDYAMVNCHNSTSCLITTLTTSTNQPMHIMTCGEVIAPNSSVLNCSEMEKYACENVMSTILNSSEVNSVSCRSVCCEETKCNVKDFGVTDPPATTLTPTTEAPVSALKCFRCAPNTTMVPPFLCDDPANYTVELCDKSTSCLTTTLTTSTNEPIYMMACGEASTVM